MGGNSGPTREVVIVDSYECASLYLSQNCYASLCVKRGLILFARDVRAGGKNIMSQSCVI